MSSRTDMDVPAAVLSTLLGVALIVTSILLFALEDGDEQTTYNVAWTEAFLAEGSAPFGGEDAVVPVTVTTPSAIVSNVTVALDCADTPGTPARPATVSWSVREGDRELDSGTASCQDDAEVVRINVTTHPDVGSKSAGSLSEAEELAYEGENRTRTFTLEFSYSRPDAQVPNPLPVGQPTIGGRMTLTALAWHATANEPEEATR